MGENIPAEQTEWNSPGNAFRINETTPLMRLPNFSFLYRLECEIAKEDVNVGSPHDAGIIRSIANILDGEVKGPRIRGKVLPLGGADWATVVEGTHVCIQVSFLLPSMAYAVYCY